MEWKEDEPRDDDRDGLLPSHEYNDSDNDNDGDQENGDLEGGKSIKGMLFVILGTTATLAARRILRDGFRELT